MSIVDAEIIINGQTADLPIDFANQLKLSSVLEIKGNDLATKHDDGKPSKGTLHLSSLSLPATLRNSQVFEHGHTPAIVDQYANKFMPIQVNVGGNKLLDGICLRTESTKQKGKPTSFRINVWASTAHWYNEKIMVCDVAPNNFIWDEQDIEQNQNDTAIINPVDAGYEFVYFHVIRRNVKNSDSYYNDLYPNLLLKPMIDKYFNQQGFQVDWDLMDSEVGKRLCFPHTWGRFGNTEEFINENVKVVASIDNSAGETYQANQLEDLIFFDDSTLPNYDLGSNYDTTTGTYTAPISGNYIVKMEWSNFLLDLSGIVGSSDPTFEIHIYIDNTFSYSFDIFQDNNSRTFDVFLNQNETFNIKLLFDEELIIYNATLYITKPSIYILGDSVDWKTILPNDLPFIEILSDVMIMFDAYTETDFDLKKVTIRSRHGGELNTPLGTVSLEPFFREDIPVVDWEQKWDISKTASIQETRVIKQLFRLKFQDDKNNGFQNQINQRSGTSLYSVTMKFPEEHPPGLQKRSTKHLSTVAHTVINKCQFMILVRDIRDEIGDEYQNKDIDFKPVLTYYAGRVSAQNGHQLFNGIERNVYYLAFQVPYIDNRYPSLSFADQTLLDGTLKRGLMWIFYLKHLARRRNNKELEYLIQLSNTDISQFSHRQVFCLDNMKVVALEMNNFKPILL
ncbi:MAG: hypothetical protein ACPG5B_02220 [Chitinophagales bacterium]